jgi:hypothetical protein
MNEAERQKREALVQQAADRVLKKIDLPGLFAAVRDYSKTPFEERIAKQKRFEANLRAARAREKQNAERLKDQQS